MTESRGFDLCYIFPAQMNRKKTCPEKHPRGFKSARKQQFRSALWELCGMFYMREKTDSRRLLNHGRRILQQAVHGVERKVIPTGWWWLLFCLLPVHILHHYVLKVINTPTEKAKESMQCVCKLFRWQVHSIRTVPFLTQEQMQEISIFQSI